MASVGQGRGPDRSVGFVERAAAWPPERAWHEQYAGLHDKDRAFQLTSPLDLLALRLDRVDSAVRSEAVRVSRWMLGERGT